MSEAEELIGTWILNETIDPPAEDVKVTADVSTPFYDGLALILTKEVASGLTGAFISYFTICKAETVNSGTVSYYKDGTASGWATSGKVAQIVSLNDIIFHDNTGTNRTFSITKVNGTDDITYFVNWLKANAVKRVTAPAFARFYRNPDSKLIGTGTYKFRPYTKIAPPAQPDANNILGTWILNETISDSAFLSSRDCPDANGVFETINGTYDRIEFREADHTLRVIGFRDSTRTLRDLRFYTVLGVGDYYVGGSTGVAAVLSATDGLRITSIYAATVEARTIKIISVGEGEDDTYLLDKMLEWFRANATKTSD